MKRSKNDNVYRLLAALLMMVGGLTASAQTDSASYETPRPRDFDALRFSLDTHHRYTGDQLSHGHTYIDFGAGLMMVQTAGSDSHLPMTGLHLRLGRQFSDLHSARIGLTGALGYMDNGNTSHRDKALTGLVGAEADYLFSLSSYLLGYRPERPLDVSAMVGLGVSQAMVGHGSNRQLAAGLKEEAFSANLHAGVQLKFFAGPHAALTAEPYIMLSSTGIDLSDNTQNWHRYSVAYGLNLSYIYYLKNMLSAPALAGGFRKHFATGQRWLRGDAADSTQRRPLFMEYAVGPVAYNTFDDLRWANTMGPMATVGVGGWLSSAIGLRASVNVANADWREAEGKTDMMGYASVAVDALLNPFGFTRHYDWEAPAGLTLLAGYEFGMLKMVNTGSHNRSNVMGYRLGMQPWVRLSHDTRLFIEPMYAFLLHRQGEANRKRDDQLSLKVGLDVLLGGRRDVDTDQHAMALSQGYFIAAGGGWNTTFRKWKWAHRNTGFFKNGVLLGGYHFDPYNGVALSGEYLTETVYRSTDKQRWEHWLLSADYLFNLSNGLTGYQPHRRWNIGVMAGPTAALGGEKVFMGLNGGLLLDYSLSRHLSLFYLHRLYWMDKRLYTSDQLYNQLGTLVSSMNVGLMYKFDDLVGPVTRVARGFAAGVSQGASTVARGVGNLLDQTRSPLFLDYGYGLATFPSLPASGTDNWGNSLQMSVGWWMLPSIGVRGGVNVAQGGAVRIPARQFGGNSDVVTTVANASLFADVMVAPLGFVRRYNWDSRFGFHLIGGVQKGIIAVEGHNSEALGRDLYATGWRAGMQLWARLQDDLRLHVEPMYTRLTCNDLYVDDDTKTRVRRTPAAGYSALSELNGVSIRVGLTALLRNGRQRNGGQETPTPARPHFFASLGGGWNFHLGKWHYTDGGLNVNALLVGGYRFNAYHTLLAQAEYVSDVASVKGHDASRERLTLFSADYQLDLTTLLGGYDAGRRWEVALFGGPTTDSKRHLGVNLGASAAYHLDQHWSIVYRHNAYVLPLPDGERLLPAAQLSSRVSALNTFNFGVMHRF